MSLPTRLKAQFPIFTARPDLVYLDNAATTHKPQSVIDAEYRFYEQDYATVHRGVYTGAEKATYAYEEARRAMAALINAAPEEIVFTSNATAALNLAAWIACSRLKKGDNILVSAAEHHSNLLPWQRWGCAREATLQWVELTADHQFDMTDFENKLSEHTKLVATAHVSNVLGYVAPLQKIITAAHRANARVIIDAAQSVPLYKLDVKALDVDYMAFSGHKMYGPTGIGFLYAKRELLALAEPLLVGGGTVERVLRERVKWLPSPRKFEAGTPPVAQSISLTAAARFIEQLPRHELEEHYEELTTYALSQLSRVTGLTLYGPNEPKPRAPIFSFTLTVKGALLHSHDVCALASEAGVALRGGHHCAEPLMHTLGIGEVVRASCGLYNTKNDIDTLVDTLSKVKLTLGTK